MTTTTVQITGLHCASCVSLIRDVSSEFPGIQNVDVDLPSKCITLEHNNAFDLAKWKEEIEALGETYKVADVSW